jgi:chromosome segregation ATPase
MPTDPTNESLLTYVLGGGWLARELFGFFRSRADASDKLQATMTELANKALTERFAEFERERAAWQQERIAFAEERKAWQAEREAWKIERVELQGIIGELKDEVEQLRGQHP